MVYGLAAADFAICGIWIPKMACSIIGQSWTRYMAEVLGRGALAAVPVVAAGLLFRAAAPIDAAIPRIAALGLVVGLSGLASLFYLWLSRDEKLQVAALARALGNRSR
jgi:hypothetical protein